VLNVDEYAEASV